MSTHTSSELDRELAPILADSWIARRLSATVRVIHRAWRGSWSRRRAADVTDPVRRLSRAQRLQTAAIVGVVAMAAHIGLVVLDARAIEPLTLLLPALVIVVCGVLFVSAERMSRLLERSE